MKTCPKCQKEFDGRSNQKFCTPNCKNAFHNSENKLKEQHVKHINRALHKNWTTLQKIFDIYRSSPIKKEVLEAYGFNEKYHTHKYKSPSGESYNMVYDMAFKPYFDNQIQVVKLED